MGRNMSPQIKLQLDSDIVSSSFELTEDLLNFMQVGL